MEGNYTEVFVLDTKKLKIPKKKLGQLCTKLNISPNIQKKNENYLKLASALLKLFVPEAILQQSHKDLYFEKEPRGKPFLKGINFSFNISHDGDYTFMVAERSSSLLGIDVVSPTNPVTKTIFDSYDLSIKPSWLSPNEVVYLQSHLPVQQNWLRILWALKESFVKAIGVGLSMDLSDIDFEISETGQVCGVKVKGDAKLGWQFFYWEKPEVTGGNTIISVSRWNESGKFGMIRIREVRAMELIAHFEHPVRMIQPEGLAGDGGELDFKHFHNSTDMEN